MAPRPTQDLTHQQHLLGENHDVNMTLQEEIPDDLKTEPDHGVDTTSLKKILVWNDVSFIAWLFQQLFLCYVVKYGCVRIPAQCKKCYQNLLRFSVFVSSRRIKRFSLDLRKYSRAKHSRTTKRSFLSIIIVTTESYLSLFLDIQPIIHLYTRLACSVIITTLLYNFIPTYIPSYIHA